MVVDKAQFGTGYSDGLTPLKPLDVVAPENISALLQAYAQTGFGARRLGEAADTFEAMLKDPDCFVVATLSGAMTVAKMGLLVCEMVERGYIHAIVSTGALMAHGLVEGSGRTHFKHDPSMRDEDLYEKGYDRVYDTLELEQNLNDVAGIIGTVLDAHTDEGVLSSWRLMQDIGQHLDSTLKEDERAILKSCVRHNVPVFVPAFTDSEVGLDVANYNQRRMRAHQPRRAFDPFLDLEHFARLLSAQKTIGIFTIGGGVPRNWAQQLGPFVDLLTNRGDLNLPQMRYKYALRICPEPVHWGGLSGCTYSEGISWGKFIPPAEGGRFSEVHSDATIAWPLLVRAMVERVPKVDKSLPSGSGSQEILSEAMGSG